MITAIERLTLADVTGRWLLPVWPMGRARKTTPPEAAGGSRFCRRVIHFGSGRELYAILVANLAVEADADPKVRASHDCEQSPLALRGLACASEDGLCRTPRLTRGGYRNG